MGNRQSAISHPWLALLVITILGGALRFYSLDRPSVWGDEAATWRRISGSWQQLTDELRHAGFQPGQYVLTWWIKEGFPVGYERQRESQADADVARARLRERGGPPERRADRNVQATPRDVAVPTLRLAGRPLDPSPFVLRFLPALCGTLLVPAMYFLAAQLVARRTALLVALFTCFSAYQLGYARDAKMYAQLWCFATLHVGCLLWWLRAYRAPTPTGPPPPEFPKQAELGEGVAGVLPGRHVGQIARAFVDDACISRERRAYVTPPPTRLDVLVRWACWVTSGLAMMAFHAVGLGILGIELLIFLATVPLRAGAMRRTAVAVAAPFLYARELARPPRIATPPPFPSAEADDVVVPFAVETPAHEHRVTLARPMSSASVEAAPFESPGERLRRRLSAFALPPIVGFVIGVAAIGSLWWSYREFTRFYDRVADTASSVEFDSYDAGISWVEPYNEGRTGASHFLANATAYLMSWEWTKPAWVAQVDPRAFMWLSRAATVLLVAIVVGLVPWRQLLARFWNRRLRFKRTRPRRDVDAPTLASLAAAPELTADDRVPRGPMPLTAMLIVGLWLLVPAYAFYTASGAWNEDGRRTRAVGPTQAIAASIFPAAANEEAKILAGAVSVDVANAIAANEPWTGLRARLARRPWGELFVVHNVDWRQPRWPWLWPAIGVGAVVLTFSRRATWRRRLAWGAGGVLALAVLWLLLLVVYVATPVQPRSVWMPRYLGFVWPAFAIAACTLIMRLPLAPLRWAIVALLLAANGTVFATRLRTAEPPTAAMADDYARATRDPSVRVFVVQQSPRPQFGGPGAGTMFTLPAAYYATRATGEPTTPRDALDYANRTIPQLVERSRDVNVIAARLKRDADAAEAIVWAELPPTAAEGATATALAAALAPAGWLPAAGDAPSRQFVYDHWTWRRLYAIERHRFTRDPAAATRPAATTPVRAAPSVPPRSPIVPATRPATARSAIAPSTRAVTRPTSRPATTPTVASTRPAAAGIAAASRPARTAVPASRVSTTPVKATTTPAVIAPVAVAPIPATTSRPATSGPTTTTTRASETPA